MIKPVIADTGVIVSLVSEKDEWHEWAKQQAARLPTPYLTCEAVVTEACHLVRGVPNGKQKVLGLLAIGALQLDFSLKAEVLAVAALMQKYADVPMDLADACLVRMSELVKDSVVFTLDTDFWVYRKHGKEQIPLIIPDKVA